MYAYHASSVYCHGPSGPRFQQSYIHVSLGTGDFDLDYNYTAARRHYTDTHTQTSFTGKVSVAFLFLHIYHLFALCWKVVCRESRWGVGGDQLD